VLASRCRERELAFDHNHWGNKTQSEELARTDGKRPTGLTAAA
jgi:hypothetical protein